MRKGGGPELTGAGPGGSQKRHHWSEGLREMRTRHTGTWGEGSQAEDGDGGSPGGLRGSQGPVWLEQSQGEGEETRWGRGRQAHCEHVVCTWHQVGGQAGLGAERSIARLAPNRSGCCVDPTVEVRAEAESS